MEPKTIAYRNIILASVLHVLLLLVFCLAIYFIAQRNICSIPGFILSDNLDQNDKQFLQDGSLSAATATTTSSGSSMALYVAIYFKLIWAAIPILVSGVAMSLSGTLAEQVIHCAFIAATTVCCIVAIAMAVLGFGGSAIVLALCSCVGDCCAAKVRRQSLLATTSLVLMSTAIVLIWCLSFMGMLMHGEVFTCTESKSSPSDAATTPAKFQYHCSVAGPTGYILLIIMPVLLHWTIYCLTEILTTISDMKKSDSSRSPAIIGGDDGWRRRWFSSAHYDSASQLTRVSNGIFDYAQIVIFFFFAVYITATHPNDPSDGSSSRSTATSSGFLYFQLIVVSICILLNGIALVTARSMEEKLKPCLYSLGFISLAIELLLESAKVNEFGAGKGLICQ